MGEHPNITVSIVDRPINARHYGSVYTLLSGNLEEIGAGGDDIVATIWHLLDSALDDLIDEDVVVLRDVLQKKLEHANQRLGDTIDNL